MTFLICALALGANLTPAEPVRLSSREEVKALIATLDADTRAATVFAWDHSARTRWYPSPGPLRPGLYVSAMSNDQRAALHRVLRSALSAQGYLSVVFVMLNQDLIARKFPGEDESSGRYSFAIYGDPNGDGLWGWRLGGHHVSVHFSYRGDRVLANTPLFLGMATVDDPDSAVRTGLQIFGHRVDRARALIVDLREHAEPARLSTSPEASFIRDAGSLPRTRTEGSAVNQWPRASRRQLARLALEYLRDVEPDLSAVHEEALQAQLDDLRFGWSGSADGGREIYYRITGRDFMLQLHCDGRHLHSMWSRSDDFGRGK